MVFRNFISVLNLSIFLKHNSTKLVEKTFSLRYFLDPPTVLKSLFQLIIEFLTMRKIRKRVVKLISPLQFLYDGTLMAFDQCTRFEPLSFFDLKFSVLLVLFPGNFI